MNRKLSNTQTDEKHAMLDELESIKDLLLDSEDLNEYDIPTLEDAILESIEKEPEQHSNDDIPLLDASSLSPQADTNRDHEELEYNLENQSDETDRDISSRQHQQQNLFQESSLVETTGVARAVKARGENPFLPKHIRDRLHGNRPVLPNNEIQPLSSSATTETDHILDDLISEFLPEIEAKLRSRLKPVIEQQLQQGPPEEPSQ